MSGDVQTRQRRKEKRKQKRDEPAIGVDTAHINESEKKNVQMHLHESDHDHGVGWCAKIVFFTLMAILAGLVALIVLENRGGSDLDTPLSESRFSEYLQGWVDETREDEHHEEVHFSPPDDDHHDDEENDGEHHEAASVPEDEPYPEEKDDSNNEDNNESDELNAEVKLNESDTADDSQEPLDDDQSQNEENDNVSDEKQDDDDERGDQAAETEEASDDVPSLFEDSAPFEEEEDNDNDDDFEDVVDNDAGEDLLLKKLAEQSEAAAQKQQESEEAADETEAEGSSSHRSDVEPEVETKRNDDLLSKRRLTMLSASDENLVDEDLDLDNEEIIEVMMVSGSRLRDDEEMYTDSELEEEEGEYSDEVVDEYEPRGGTFVPKTFEDFQTMFKHQFDSDEHDESSSLEQHVPQSSEPQSVDKEMENRVERELLRMPASAVAKRSPEPETDEGPLSQEDEYDPEEPEELSDEELIEDEEVDYEDELDSEDLSDIDDTDLMKRLEAKYGKISGENSEEEDEPDASWIKIPQQGGAQSYLDELMKENENFENFPEVKELYSKAKSLDSQAEKERSNTRLVEALVAYKTLLIDHGKKINDTIFKDIAERCIERMRFIGKLKAAVEIHKQLIARFDDDPHYRNQLAVTYLLGNHLSVAKLVLHEILIRWRYNGFALVHYGFVIKNLEQDYENAVIYLQEGINTNDSGTQDGRFYFNLGDALQRLGRNEEASEVYKKGARIGLFLSEYQRSLYNVNRLKSTPFWTKVQTTYKDDLVEIQKYWQIIRDEGLKLLSKEGFVDESENLKEIGDWKQFELFARGVKSKNCKLAPMTCKIIESFTPAASCKRGQVKFSLLHPNTHVWPHCGPTNCRLRCHLGLKVPEKTFIRVANETRSWKEGEWLIFDDSFEHEVWHNGTSLRLVLIVDVWHPDLTEDEKQSLSAI